MTYDVWVHHDDRREYVGAFCDLDVALRDEPQSPLMEIAFRGRLEMVPKLTPSSEEVAISTPSEQEAAS